MAKEIEEGKDYTKAAWVGNDPAQTPYDNHHCTRCQFSTLYIEKMQEHYDWEGKHKHHWAFPVGSEEAAKAASLGPRQEKAAQIPLKY